MVNCRLPKNRRKMECRSIFKDRCISSPAGGMGTKAIQGCINRLIFNEPTQKRLKAKDPELLSVVVLNSKKKDFNFLQGKTRWNVIGDWVNPKTGRPFPSEKNVQLDVQFKDREDEIIGRRLIALFKAYNKKKVGEEVLYTRTVPVEETSLE